MPKSINAKNVQPLTAINHIVALNKILLNVQMKAVLKIFNCSGMYHSVIVQAMIFSYLQC